MQIPDKIEPGSKATKDITVIGNIMEVAECAILAACEIYGVPRDCLMYARVQRCSSARFAVMYLLKIHGMIWKYIEQIFNRDRATCIRSKDEHLIHMRMNREELHQFIDLFWQFHANLKRGNVNTE
jgi:hypothetical protein